MMNSRLINRKLTPFFKYPFKNLTGFFHLRSQNTQQIKSGPSVTVYEAPEWEELNTSLNGYFDIIPKDEASINKMYDTWENAVMNSSFKEKYFSLLPFFVEDRQTFRAKKKFVLKMDLYPETKHLKFTMAMISGISERFEPLGDIVPLTPGDYRTRHLVLRSRPPAFMDMDMIYGNRKILDMYCFDKKGTWVKEVCIYDFNMF